MAIELDGSVKWLNSAYIATEEFFGVGCAEKDDKAYLMHVNLATGAKSETIIHSYTISTGAHIDYKDETLSPATTFTFPGSTVRTSTHIYLFFVLQNYMPDRYFGF